MRPRSPIYDELLALYERLPHAKACADVFGLHVVGVRQALKVRGVEPNHGLKVKSDRRWRKRCVPAAHGLLVEKAVAIGLLRPEACRCGAEDVVAVQAGMDPLHVAWRCATCIKHDQREVARGGIRDTGAAGGRDAGGVSGAAEDVLGATGSGDAQPGRAADGVVQGRVQGTEPDRAAAVPGA